MARRFITLLAVTLLWTGAVLAAPVLGPRIELPTRPLPRAVAIGDLDHDGIGDLAVACESDSFVTIFYGQGGGAFDPPVDLAVGPAPTCLIATDWNHDGNLDLIVGIGSADPRLRAFLGNGTRGFTPGAEGALRAKGVELQLGDFDADGLPDLVGAIASPPSEGFIFAGNPTGAFGTRHALTGPGDWRTYVAVGDFNADSLLDVYMPGSTGLLFLNAGAFNFGVHAVQGSSGGAGVVDFNQDGLDDLLVGTGTNLSLLPCANGNFGGGTTYPLPPGPFGAVTTLDLDGNNIRDGIIVHITGYGLDVVLLGCGGGVVGTQFYPTGGSPIALATGDLNGDGRADVATADYGTATISVRNANPPTAQACVPRVSTSGSLDFGTLDQLHVSDRQLIVTNVGDIVLHLGVPSTDGPEFTVVSVSNFDIGSGQNAIITVRDHRFELGVQQGTLFIPSNDPVDPIHAVALTGTVVAPARIDFDDGLSETPEVAFNASTQRTLVVRNLGAFLMQVTTSITDVGPAGENALAPPVEILTTVPLPVDRLDASGSLWNIQGDGSIATGSDGAFAGGLDPFGFPPQSEATLEDANRTFAIGPVAVGNGIEVTRKVFVSTAHGFARWLEIVTNTAPATRNYTVDLFTNLGGPVGTQVTSSGDWTFNTGDTWAVFSDGQDHAGRPEVAHVLYAGHPPGTVFVTPAGDFTRLRWPLVLPASTSTAVVHWAVQAPTTAGAVAIAQELALLHQGALDGLNQVELEMIDAGPKLPVFTPSKTVFAIQPGDSTTLLITYRGVTSFPFPADIVGTLHLASNDPFSPDTTIALSLHVTGPPDSQTTIGVPPDAVRPRLALAGLVPNPSPRSGARRVAFTLGSDARATLTLYDVRGRVVAAHVIDRPAPGPGSIALDARLPAGMLWLRLEQEGHVVTRKGIVLP